MLKKAKTAGKLLALGGALALNPGCKKKQEIANFSEVDTVMEIGVLVNDDPCNIFEIQKWIMERAREVILEIQESTEKETLRNGNGAILMYRGDVASYSLSLNFDESGDHLTFLALDTFPKPSNEHLYPQVITFNYNWENGSIMVWSNDEYDLETYYFQSGRLANKLAIGEFGQNLEDGEKVWATDCRRGPEEVETHIQFLKELEALAKSFLPEPIEETQPEQSN